MTRRAFRGPHPASPEGFRGLTQRIARKRQARTFPVKWTEARK